MIRALALVFALSGVAPAADARAYDYRDARGVRHWNHYAAAGARRHHHRARHHRPHVRIIKDRLKFVPLDDEPAPAAQSAPAAAPQEEGKPIVRDTIVRGTSPYGALIAPRAVPVELFKPKGAE